MQESTLDTPTNHSNIDEDTLNLTIEMLQLIFKSGATKKSNYPSLLTPHVDYSINYVNAPTSKAIGVLLGICPSKHDRDITYCAGILYSVYKGLHMPAG
eukprot:3626615-Ditylum_brightwellii.AAC.1